MPYARHVFAAELVKKLRMEQGYSARTFGEAIGTTGRHVRRYEARDSEPPLTTAGRMARALGVPLDSLYVHAPDATDPSGGRKQSEKTPAALASSARESASAAR